MLAFETKWRKNKVTKDHGDEGDAFVTKCRKNKVTKKQTLLTEIKIVEGSSASHYFFDIVELVQGFDRCKVVDVEAKYLVAYLREHGVVELEET